jgi:hypothetical protein
MSRVSAARDLEPAARPPPQRVRRSEESRGEEGAAAPRAAHPVAADRSNPARRLLRRGLSSRQAIRRAIVLHAILGPPKASERPAR